MKNAFDIPKHTKSAEHRDVGTASKNIIEHNLSRNLINQTLQSHEIFDV